MKAIINGKIIHGLQIIEGKVLVFEKTIVGMMDQAPDDAEIIDAKGSFVAPGFVDLHIHGAGGHDVMEGTREALESISRQMIAAGVTSFLPTTMTMDKASIRRVFEQAKKAMEVDLPGARVVGIHMEGPFLSLAKKGSQNPDYLVKADGSYIKGYEDVIRLITLAPEEDENHRFIKKVRAHTDIRLSIGHSNASFEDALAGIEAGCSVMTHFFNGMTGLNHRNPGCVGAGFATDVFVELIADTIHVHPGLYDFIVKAKGVDRVILVTDSMEAGGLGDGTYSLGDQEVLVAGGAARLKDGTLAGSVLTMIKAVENMMRHTSLTLPEVVAMATWVPATAIGLEGTKGSLHAGKDADILLFSASYQVKKTWVGGECR